MRLDERGNMGSTVLVSFITALVTSLAVFFGAADFMDRDNEVKDETAQEIRELREDINNISEDLQEQMNNTDNQ